MAKEEKQDLNEELKNKTEEVEESTDTEVEELIEVDELTETKVALDEMEDRYLRLQAELANIRKIMRTAIWARNVMLLNISRHFLIAPAGNICAVKAFDKIVCSVACFAFTAVHKRI